MFKVSKRFNQKGFTLVELLVVIAIIGILATVLLLQLGTARGKARDAKRVADLNQVASALELYYDDNGFYPAQSDLAALAPRYLARVPVDPLTAGCTSSYTSNGCYGYAWSPNVNPISFHLWAELEQDTKALDGDSDADSSGYGGINASLATSEACGDNSLTTVNCLFDIKR